MYIYLYIAIWASLSEPYVSRLIELHRITGNFLPQHRTVSWFRNPKFYELGETVEIQVVLFSFAYYRTQSFLSFPDLIEVDY